MLIFASCETLPTGLKMSLVRMQSHTERLRRTINSKLTSELMYCRAAKSREVSLR